MKSEAPMPELRCPQLDLIDRALIEAYRWEESGIPDSASKAAVAANREIARLHELIRLHRSACPICKGVLARAVPESRFQIVRNVA
jgi:hypothetical protein